MAKKGKSKKDKEKEDIEKGVELNEGTQEDINEADDSFGLPDIDFKPLDEIEDEAEPDPESEPEPEEDSEAKPEPEPESESDEPGFEDEYAVTNESEKGYQEEFIDDSEEEEIAESVEEETIAAVPPPRKFEHPKESSATPKIIIGILIAIIVLSAGYYFGMYKPQQAEKARIEQEEKDRLAEEARLREEERLAQEAREREEAAQQEMAEAEPEPGTIMAISEPTGRYYVVIGSFVDEDLAADLANRISADGVTTMVLAPVKPKGFTRVALSDYGSWAEAQSSADQMKGEFGEKVWVFKY